MGVGPANLVYFPRAREGAGALISHWKDKKSCPLGCSLNETVSGPHPADPAGRQTFLHRLRISSHQSARPEEHASEIPRDHHGHVADPGPKEHLQHGPACRSRRFPVVAAPGQLRPAANAERGTIMPRVPVLLLHLLDELHRLGFRLTTSHRRDKAGFFFLHIRPARRTTRSGKKSFPSLPMKFPTFQIISHRVVSAKMRRKTQFIIRIILP